MTDALDPLTLPLLGTSLIEASAGTGKTHAIATLFLRLLLESELRVDEILVVTFTEAAAAELRDRVRVRLRGALAELGSPGEADADVRQLLAARRARGLDDRPRLEAALRGFDLATIATIHGFCQGVLQRSAFETGVALATELVVDELPLVDQVVRDYWARELYDAEPRFVRHLQESQVVPPKLQRLARLAAAHPDLTLFPPRVVDEGDPDLRDYLRCYREVRALWHRERDSVTALLLGSEVLHRREYPKADMPAWFTAMDAFLREPEPGALLAFGVFDRFCTSHLAEKTHADARRVGLVPRHPFFDACESLLQARAPLEKNFALQQIDFKLRLAKYVRRELPRRKRAAQLQSFDDLLLQLDAALRGRHGKRLAERIRSRFRAALIDEFQDTDPVQYRIFKTLFGQRGGSLLLIGDPKQAIYAFRGADVYAYLEAARSIGGRRVTMRHNWRSDPPLLAAVERLFDVHDPFALSAIELPQVLPRPGAHARLQHDGAPLPAMTIATISRDGAELRGRHATKEWAEQVIPGRVAEAIAALLQQGATLEHDGEARPIHAGDIAVLTRKNVQALAVQAALRERGIPSVVYGDSTVFESTEAAELARVLAAVAEPTHAGLLRAALATELLGVRADALAQLDQDDASWERWVELFRALHELWAQRGFVQMFRALLARSDAPARLLADATGERRMTNLLHTAELLHAAASEQHLGPAGLLRWLEEQRRERNTMVEAFKLRLERDDRAVQLITVHRSKGLEYPIVFCPYAWDADELFGDEKEDTLYHDPRDGLRAVLDVRPAADEGKKPALDLARREREAEALRLLYVAVTRARHRCVLVWVPSSRSHQSALAQLLWSPRRHEPRLAPELVQRRVQDQSDAAMIEHLQRRGEGVWTVASLPAAPQETIAASLAAVASPATLSLRAPRATLDRLWRTSSFSQMAAAPVSTEAAPAVALGPDWADARAHDEDLAAAPRVGELVIAAGPTVPLAEFPRGVRAGNFFHDLLEHLDFSADDDARAGLVATTLAAHGFEPRWQPVVDGALAQILTTPLLEHGGPRLCDVPRAQRLDELEFLLPVADLDTSLGRRALAQAFREHPGGLPPGYADRVASLAFAPLRGFLKGFIDLVFVHEGRWWVVDYKTNHLGDNADDYQHARLATAMSDDHYVLQYHLYTVALVRLVAQRQRDFDYERDFGGVLYLFLRGMAPGAPGGIWRERPPLSRIAMLSAMLQRPEGPRS